MGSYIGSCIAAFGLGFAICGLIFTMQLKNIVGNNGYIHMDNNYYKLVKVKFVEVEND